MSTYILGSAVQGGCQEAWVASFISRGALLEHSCSSPPPAQPGCPLLTVAPHVAWLFTKEADKPISLPLWAVFSHAPHFVAMEAQERRLFLHQRLVHHHHDGLSDPDRRTDVLARGT